MCVLFPDGSDDDAARCADPGADLAAHHRHVGHPEHVPHAAAADPGAGRSTTTAGAAAAATAADRHSGQGQEIQRAAAAATTTAAATAGDSDISDSVRGLLLNSSILCW